MTPGALRCYVLSTASERSLGSAPGDRDLGTADLSLPLEEASAEGGNTDPGQIWVCARTRVHSYSQRTVPPAQIRLLSEL